MRKDAQDPAGHRRPGGNPTLVEQNPKEFKMRKKLISLLAIGALAIPLTACGNDSAKEPAAENSAPVTEATEAEPTTEKVYTAEDYCSYIETREKDVEDVNMDYEDFDSMKSSFQELQEIFRDIGQYAPPEIKQAHADLDKTMDEMVALVDEASAWDMDTVDTESGRPSEVVAEIEQLNDDMNKSLNTILEYSFEHCDAEEETADK